MVEEQQQLLMKLLKENGRLEQLKEWPSELAVKFEHMLMEHHYILSLDKNEIGCTDATQHELMDDEVAILTNRPSTVGRNEGKPTGHAGQRHNLAFQLPVVQHDSPCQEEGWNVPFLY